MVPFTSQKAFSLIEIMLVVGVIGILVVVATANFSESTVASRDAKRQADIRQIQIALEAYKNKFGRYPAQCVQADAGAAGGWSGQLGTDYRCSNGTGDYIVGLAPEFIPVLPTDPKLNGTNSGYVYRVDANREVYKLMVLRTVEAETVTWAHELSSCFIDPVNNASADIRVSGWCNGVFFNANNRPAWCEESDTRFQTSYGAWGGFAAFVPTTLASLDAAANNNARISAVRNTTTVICR